MPNKPCLSLSLSFNVNFLFIYDSSTWPLSLTNHQHQNILRCLTIVKICRWHCLKADSLRLAGAVFTLPKSTVSRRAHFCQRTPLTKSTVTAWCLLIIWCMMRLWREWHSPQWRIWTHSQLTGNSHWNSLKAHFEDSQLPHSELTRWLTMWTCCELSMSLQLKWWACCELSMG